MIEEKARRYLLAPPNVGFLVAPRRERFARRKRAPAPQRVADASA
jgi:hypothetical protein